MERIGSNENPEICIYRRDHHLRLMTDWKLPEPNVLVALASLAVHLEEYIEGGGTAANFFDIQSCSALMELPYLKEWLDSVPSVLKPVKRSDDK